MILCETDFFGLKDLGFSKSKKTGLKKNSVEKEYAIE